MRLDVTKMPSTEKDADEMIMSLGRCQYCWAFRRNDLFSGECTSPEWREPFPVDNNEGCEAFHAKDKKVEYWIDKLVQISLECGGHNDFYRQLDYHERNGTEKQFLDL